MVQTQARLKGLADELWASRRRQVVRGEISLHVEIATKMGPAVAKKAAVPTKPAAKKTVKNKNKKKAAPKIATAPAPALLAAAAAFVPGAQVHFTMTYDAAYSIMSHERWRDVYGGEMW